MGEEEGVSKVEFKNILSFSIFCGYEGCGKEAIRVDIDEISGEVTTYYIRKDEPVINERKILNKGFLERLIYDMNHGHIGDVYASKFGQKSALRKGLPDFCLECGCAYCEKHSGDRVTHEKSHCIYTEWECPNGHKYKYEYKSR